MDRKIRHGTGDQPEYIRYEYRNITTARKQQFSREMFHVFNPASRSS